MHTFTLYNGLRCVVSRRAESAMALVDVLYDVGSRDERPDLTGMAHLFEHLMFGGSANVPSFDGELEAAGGESNAWTNTDFTNFYDYLPARNLATALHLESDRMLALSFRETTLEVQRSVVREEFKQTHLNAPYGDLGHHLRRLVYDGAHPYSWPTIGKEPEHIARVTMADVRSWFYSHYAPNNAILSIVAPQPEAEIEAMVREWFAGIPRREIAPRRLPDPGFPKAETTEFVSGDVPAVRVVVAYPMAPYGSEEYFAADTITDLLGYGRSCRFFRQLLNGPHAGFFTEADACIYGCEEPGVLMLTGTLAPQFSSDNDAARAVGLLTDEFARLSDPGDISGHELQRVMNNFEATQRFAALSPYEEALRNAQALYHGETPDQAIRERLRLTPASLASAAATIVARPRAILIYGNNVGTHEPCAH